ncbi:AAA family ATPase [Rhodococcus sp. NPDC060090]|uniref:AAA family ATPase n=1 Tax=Rhodococcus sp. NPDC060090 TaxID=3347056 RepID=UPI00364BE3F1
MSDSTRSWSFTDVAEVLARFDSRDHLLDEGTASAIYLAAELGRPLLLEGEPGVGKTTAAKVLADVLGSKLIRLQCYEGLSTSEALYDWNYQRQLLAIRLAEVHGNTPKEDGLYTEEYLLERPILECVRHRGDAPAVLLVDEIDRADDEFEALLLEFLGEFSVTVPELGTLTAAQRPVVVLTSNRSRDLHDALRRRCLYHWIDYPDRERAVAILRRTVPEANAALVARATDFVAAVRGLDLDKAPGIAETIDWVSALSALGVSDLARPGAGVSLAALAKTPDDRDAVGEAFTDFVVAGSS